MSLFSNPKLLCKKCRCWIFLGLSVAAAFAVPLPAEAVDWPQWRGPDRNDRSAETGLLQSWPKAGPKQVWLSRDCGLGYSGPAVVGDRLYILGARGDEEWLLCLSVESGDEIWAKPVGKLFENDWGNGPRNTPTVSGDRVFALGASGNLICFRRKDGKPLWTQSMLDLGGEIPKWGYAESPLVDGKRVLCTPGGKQGAIVALNKATGKPMWQSSELNDIAHYSSIISATVRGRPQYIQLLEKRLVGIRPRDGTLLWQVPWGGSVAVIPTPIFHDGKCYVSSGYGAGCMLVDVEAKPPKEVYSNKVMTNHHGGVIRLGDYLYGHSDRKGWTCQAFATGKSMWREKSALGKGAIAYADGRFYCLDEGDGSVVLIAASPEGWQEHGRFTLDPQTELRKPAGRIWTHPVIANGRLYLRDQELLFSFDVQKQ